MNETKKEDNQKKPVEIKVLHSNNVKEKKPSFTMQLKFAKTKNEYIRNIINGRYYLARANMLSEQLISGKILETIDGCPKTKEYIRAEYALTKMQAIMSMRGAHFAKKDLASDFGLRPEDITDIEIDYYDGKIIREDYDEGYRKKKAEFVNSPEN